MKRSPEKPGRFKSYFSSRKEHSGNLEVLLLGTIVYICSFLHGFCDAVEETTYGVTEVVDANDEEAPKMD